MRLAAILLSCLLGIAWVDSAIAADGSARKVLGFSPDGGSFAFAQSGVQDGSGFPYADVFVIDTRTDAAAAPPVHVLLESETATREQAEAQAIRQAKPGLDARKIGPRGRLIGVVIASKPDDELLATDTMNGEFIAASALALDAPELGDAPKLAITPIKFDLPRCTSIVEGQASGFALSLTRREQPALVLHKDTEVPESRYCPRKYGLSEAHLFAPSSGPPVIAVLMEVYGPGFEGPDRRFLAVTGRVAK